MSLNEEKQILKEINDIRRSLPYAEPLEALTKQMNDAKKEKKVLFEKMSGFRDQLNILNKEIDEAQLDLEKIHKNKDEESTNLNPFLQQKKDEKDNKINELKDLRKRVKAKFHEDRKKHEEQQELIEQITWMTKIKQRLQRDAERKKYEEEEQKLIDADKEDKKQEPYQEEKGFFNNIRTLQLIDRLLQETKTKTERRESCN